MVNEERLCPVCNWQVKFEEIEKYGEKAVRCLKCGSCFLVKEGGMLEVIDDASGFCISGVATEKESDEFSYPCPT
ncbi:hypothetical protein K8R32_01680 [bacterium]|nr:hypothetical protein [bacterium]